MSKVYVLSEYDYDIQIVLRIFSTETKALLYKEVLKDIDPEKTYVVQEHEVKD